MHRLIAIVLIAAMVLAPASLVVGQDITRFRLPAGTRCQASGQTYQCYNLGEFRELLQMDEDFRALTLQHASEQVELVQLQVANSEFQLALTAASDQIVTLTSERARLTSQWEAADAALRELQNRPDWSWIPWSLAAAFAVTTIVLGLILGLEHN